MPLESQDGAVANTGPGTEQIPDSEVTFGRETSTLETSTAQDKVSITLEMVQMVASKIP